MGMKFFTLWLSFYNIGVKFFTGIRSSFTYVLGGISLRFHCGCIRKFIIIVICGGDYEAIWCFGYALLLNV